MTRVASLRTKKRRPKKIRTRKRRRGVTPRSKRLIGGEVFASGGFGCVFRPPLVCKGSTTAPERMISKLMPTRYAQEEYDNIKTIESALNHIPNYANYFLLEGIQLCAPAPLKDGDKKGIHKCHSMERRSITESNINAHLDDLRMLHIPDGGEPIDDFTARHVDKPGVILRLHESLIQLLERGIVPMNKSGIYHADIKDSNVLAIAADASFDHIYTRLIDWGVSFRYDPSAIADRFVDSSLQYNVPYSSILFNETLKDEYRMWAQTPESSRDSIEGFTAFFVYAWVRNNMGHLSAIQSDVKNLTPPKLPSNVYSELKRSAREFIGKRSAGYARIVHYLAAVLRKYGRPDGSVDLLSYYNNVFIHNLDIWGFFTIYRKMASVLSSTHSKWDMFSNAIEDITLNHIFDSPGSVISVPTLIAKLRAITPILHNAAGKQ